jgi:chaperonin GroES
VYPIAHRFTCPVGLYQKRQARAGTCLMLNERQVSIMHIRPIHDRIIIQRIDEGEQKVGGIIIPDSAKEKPQQGKVIAAGSGKAKEDGKRIPLAVTAGDTILFGKYSGHEIKFDGEDYLIMNEDDVLAVIDRPIAHETTK